MDNRAGEEEARVRLDYAVIDALNRLSMTPADLAALAAAIRDGAPILIRERWEPLAELVAAA